MIKPRVSVLIPVFNGAGYIEACLQSVHRQTLAPQEIIVVDDCSTDGSIALIEGIGFGVRLLRNRANLGFARTVNFGLAQAQSYDYIALLNQDTLCDPDWLLQLCTAFNERKGLGIAGCKITYPNSKKLQHAGGFVQVPEGYAGHFGYGQEDDGQWDVPREVEFVTGAALVISHEAITRIGGLDEELGRAYYEDVDWCFRARKAGLGVQYVPTAQVVHREHSAIQSRSYLQQFLYHRARICFVLKHFTPEVIDQCLQRELLVDAEKPVLSEHLARARAYLVNAGQLSSTRAKRERLYAADQQMCAGDQFWSSVLTRLLLAREVALKGSWQALEEEPAAGNRVAGGPLRAPVVAPDGGELHEFMFVSSVPVLGRVIARLRQAWYNVAARWAVQDLARQQTAFNLQVAGVLQDLARQQNALNLQVAGVLQAVQALDRRTDLLRQEMLYAEGDLAEQLQRMESPSGIIAFSAARE